MIWSDLPRHPSHRVLRQFAVTWLLVFLSLAAWQGLGPGRVSLAWALATAALVIGLSGTLWPPGVRWVFVGCMTLTFPIGWLISKLLLALLYFGVFTPLALWFRLRGRDTLLRKPQAVRSYWQPTASKTEARRYFKQY